MSNFKNNLHNSGDFGRDLFANMHIATIIPFSTLMIGQNNVPGKNNKLGALAFIAKALAANALTSAAQSVTPYLEALVAEALFIGGQYWYYKFLLNPQNVNFSHTKLQVVEETSDLTIVNTYRNAASNLSFKGISGCTLPREFMVAMGSESALPRETLSRYPKLSSAWIKFRQLEKFYTEINSDIVLMYDMDLYIGKFVSFGYSLDANNPWVINYDMAFKLYPDLMLHTLSAYDYTTFFNAMFDRYGRSFAQDFEGKSKEAKK